MSSASPSKANRSSSVASRPRGAMFMAASLRLSAGAFALASTKSRERAENSRYKLNTLEERPLPGNALNPQRTGGGKDQSNSSSTGKRHQGTAGSASATPPRREGGGGSGSSPRGRRG